MSKLIKLLKSLLTAGKPKTHSDTIRVRMNPKVDPETGQAYTYGDVTSQVAVGTIITFGGTDYRFEASPSGTMYQNKSGQPTPQKYDQFSLVHTIAVDDWDTAFDLA